MGRAEGEGPRAEESGQARMAREDGAEPASADNAEPTPAVGESLLLSEADLRAYAEQEARLKTLRRTGLVRERRNRDVRSRLGRDNVLLVVLLVLTAGAWVVGRVYMLRRVYASLYAQLEDARFLRGPVPRGEVSYGGLALSVAIEYPALYGVGVGLGWTQPLAPHGARFLLLMLQTYASDLTRVHWSGDGTQLGAAHVDGFVASWTAWNAPSNAFRWLFKDRDAFDHSIMVRGRRCTGGRANIGTLYSGGLCGLASAISVDTSRTAEDVFAELTGTFVVAQVDCGATRAMAAVSSVTNAFGMGATGLGVLSMAGMSILSPVGLGVLGVTGLFSAVAGNQSYNATLCEPPRASVRLSATEYTLDGAARCEGRHGALPDGSP